MLSVHVLNKFAHIARRKLKRPWSEIEGALAAFAQLCPAIRPLILATHHKAVRLAATTGLAFTDARIVASALEANCTRLLTEDRQHGRVVNGRLTIHNPSHPQP